MGKYYVTIQSHLWNGDKEFNDFKSAIEYAKEMEAYYYGMLKYHHKGNATVTITVFDNTKVEEEYHIEIISKNNILTSTWYYNGEHKEKRREVLDSKLTVGDSVSFKDGRTGIVEDYDDKYFYVRDNNTNIVKIKKSVKDEDFSSQSYLDYLKKVILPKANEMLVSLSTEVSNGINEFNTYKKGINYVISFCERNKPYVDTKTGIEISYFYNDQAYGDKVPFMVRIILDDENDSYQLFEENKNYIENEIFKDYSYDDDNLFYTDAWDNDLFIKEEDFE